MTPAKRLPLFIISGASGVGKSTLCEILFQSESDYVVMEGDLLWHEIYNTPEDDYQTYRKLWMRVCASISQIGKPVVLCGCAVPVQYENQDERGMFTDIHYLAVVCKGDQLEERMKKGRGITDENRVINSLAFNRWLIENAGKTVPQITLLDTTDSAPEQAAEMIHEWILERL